MNHPFKILALAALSSTLLACPGGDDDGGSDRNNDDDDGLPGPSTGTPKEASRFFLPAADEVRNTVNPSIETDAEGGLHIVYPAYAVGDAFYAYCGPNCAKPEQVKSVKLSTDGTVYNAMLALGQNNKPHVLMSTYQRVYYAVCTGDCTQPSGWQQSVVVEFPDGDREVSGEAFTLTPDGKPRFLMHAYRAFLGIGQPPPATFLVGCDGNCSQAASWTVSRISTQIWAESTLRYTPNGHAKLATIATVEDENGSKDFGAYLECTDGSCTTEDSWVGSSLYASFSDVAVEEIQPAISLSLTSAGLPRVLLLGKSEAGKRNLAYLACDANCSSGEAWNGQILIESDNIGAGLDLAIDSKGYPRFVYTAASNIFLAHCDATDCVADSAPWKLGKVEMGSDMPPDEIFPYPNCNVGAWFLRYPSLALGKDGLPRVAYRAEDISGGWSNPDPTKPSCQAGADMTFARFAQLPKLPEE